MQYGRIGIPVCVSDDPRSKDVGTSLRPIVHRISHIHTSSTPHSAYLCTHTRALAATRPGPPLPLVRGAAQLRCAGAPVVQIEFGTTILFLSVDATSVQLMSHDAAFM